MDTIMKAVHLMENQQSDEALSLLKGYLPMADDEEKYTIAEFYRQWGFLLEAKDILTGLLEQYPDETELNILLGDIYIELDDDQSAINVLDNIKEQDEMYIPAMLQLADLYQTQGLFEVAELKLLTAKKHDPDEPIIDFALGELFFSIGEYKRSIIYFEKLLPTKEIANISIFDRLAEANAAFGNYEVALQYYQEIESDNPDLLFKYGLTAYHADRKDIAINAWKQVIKQDQHYHPAYYELAKAYQEEGFLNEAFATSKEGLKMDEFNKELYFYTGVLAHQLDKDSESEDLIRQAITLDSDYKEAILFLIKLFKMREDHTEIIALITEIKNLGAIDPLYEWELARAYNEIESYNNALKHYKEAYNSLNEDNEFLKEYGYFLTEEGRVAEAIPIFETYLENEASDVDMAEYLNRLKNTYQN